MAPDKSLNLMVLPIAHLEKCNNYKIKKKANHDTPTTMAEGNT